MKLFGIAFVFLNVYTLIFGFEPMRLIDKKRPLDTRKYPLRRFNNCADSCNNEDSWSFHLAKECYLVPVAETKLTASKCVAKCYFDLERELYLIFT